MVTWHADSAFLMIANEKSQMQCFDISLFYIQNQYSNEYILPTNVLDISILFSNQPSLIQIKCGKKMELIHNKKFLQADSNVLLLFEDGPLAMVRFFCINGYKIDIYSSGLTADMLIHQYLKINNVEKAINILLCLNWDKNGARSMISLQKISNYIFKQPFQTERVAQLQKALGSFLVPVKELYRETQAEFDEQVKDITRKFFQYLVRYKSYEKAFTLALDIEDDDLFMDLYNCARENGYPDLANDAYVRAREILTYQDSSSPSKD